MKRLLLFLLVLLPALGFGQGFGKYQPAGLLGKKHQYIYLKLDKEEAIRQSELAKAEKYIIIGSALSAVGLGVGLVAPTLTNESGKPASLEKNLRIGGGCIFAAGIGFGINGAIKRARLKAY